MSGAPRPDTWMPIYWGDYDRDTGHLNDALHGAYLMLIKHYWSTGRPLPDDDHQLWRIACCDSLHVWRTKRRPILSKLFTISQGNWCHPRVDFELGNAKAVYAARLSRTEAARAAKAQKALATSAVTTSVTEDVTDPVAGTQPQPQPQSQKKGRERETPDRPLGAPHFIPINGALAPIPKTWAPDEGIKMFAMAKGISDQVLNLESERFRDHHIGKGTMMADPNALFRKWLNSRRQFENQPAAKKGRDPKWETFCP